MDPDNVERLLQIIDLLDRLKARMEQLTQRGELSTRRGSKRRTVEGNATERPPMLAMDTPPLKGESQELVGFGSRELEHLPTAGPPPGIATLTTMMSRGRSVAFLKARSGLDDRRRRKSIGALSRFEEAHFKTMKTALGIMCPKSVHFDATSSFSSSENEDEKSSMLQRAFTQVAGAMRSRARRQSRVTFTNQSSFFSRQPSQLERQRSGRLPPATTHAYNPSYSGTNLSSDYGSEVLEGSRSNIVESNARETFLVHKLSTGLSDPGNLTPLTLSPSPTRRGSNALVADGRTQTANRSTSPVVQRDSSFSSGKTIKSTNSAETPPLAKSAQRRRDSVRGVSFALTPPQSSVSSKEEIPTSSSSLSTDERPPRRSVFARSLFTHQSESNISSEGGQHAPELFLELEEDAVYHLAAASSDVLQQLFERIVTYVKNDLGPLVDKLQAHMQLANAKLDQTAENLQDAMNKTECQETEIDGLTHQLRVAEALSKERQLQIHQLQKKIAQLESTVVALSAAEAQLQSEKIKAAQENAEKIKVALKEKEMQLAEVLAKAAAEHPQSEVSSKAARTKKDVLRHATDVPADSSLTSPRSSQKTRPFTEAVSPGAVSPLKESDRVETAETPAAQQVMLRQVMNLEKQVQLLQQQREAEREEHKNAVCSLKLELETLSQRTQEEKITLSRTQLWGMSCTQQSQNFALHRKMVSCLNIPPSVDAEKSDALQYSAVLEKLDNVLERGLDHLLITLTQAAESLHKQWDEVATRTKTQLHDAVISTTRQTVIHAQHAARDAIDNLRTTTRETWIQSEPLSAKPHAATHVGLTLKAVEQVAVALASLQKTVVDELSRVSGLENVALDRAVVLTHRKVGPDVAAVDITLDPAVSDNQQELKAARNALELAERRYAAELGALQKRHEKDVETFTTSREVMEKQFSEERTKLTSLIEELRAQFSQLKIILTQKQTAFDTLQRTCETLQWSIDTMQRTMLQKGNSVVKEEKYYDVLEKNSQDWHRLMERLCAQHKSQEAEWNARLRSAETRNNELQNVIQTLTAAVHQKLADNAFQPQTEQPSSYTSFCCPLLSACCKGSSSYQSLSNTTPGDVQPPASHAASQRNESRVSLPYHPSSPSNRIRDGLRYTQRMAALQFEPHTPNAVFPSTTYNRGSLATLAPAQPCFPSHTGNDFSATQRATFHAATTLSYDPRQ